MSGIKTFSNETSERYALALFELSNENSEIEDIEKNNHWLLDNLKPMVHYIPVNFNNFEKIYKWCLYNQNKDTIKSISDNIKQFIKQFYTKNKAIQEFLIIAELGNILNI